MSLHVVHRNNEIKTVKNELTRKQKDLLMDWVPPIIKCCVQMA